MTVFPVPIFLKSSDPTSPLEALYPPLKSVWLKLLPPFSAKSANSSSPDSIAKLSISSAVMTVTGRAPVILAPLICDPTTTTSSTSDSDSSCAKRKVIGNNSKIEKSLSNFIFPPLIYLKIPYFIT